MITNKKYLYVTKCLIPQMLWKRISGLSESEQFRYAYITSFIKVMGRGNNRFNNININAKVWLSTIGSSYRRYVDDLIVWNIITIQLNEQGNESFLEGHHAKCYCVTLEANKSGWLVRDYRKRKSPAKDDKDLANSILGETDDPILNYTRRSIELLVIDYEYDIANRNTSTVIPLEEHQLDAVIDIIKGEHWLKKLESKRYAIAYGQNCGRLYHPVICMPKTAREHVWFRGSDVVMDYDIKSCFPVLLYALVPDSEKAEYKKILDGDIYASIIAGTNREREDCKVAFQQFINGFVANYVSQWFQKHFPLTYAAIEADYATMSKTLQGMESNIMVQGLINFCVANGFEGVVTCHDGYMTSGSFQHSAEVGRFVKNEFFKACGCMPDIKASTRRLAPIPPFPTKANSDGKTITDEDEALLLQHPTYLAAYCAVRSADRERKRLAKAIHRRDGDVEVILRQRKAKRQYIHCFGEWVKLLENYLQINQ